MPNFRITILAAETVETIKIKPLPVSWPNQRLGITFGAGKRPAPKRSWRAVKTAEGNFCLCLGSLRRHAITEVVAKQCYCSTAHIFKTRIRSRAECLHLAEDEAEN